MHPYVSEYLSGDGECGALRLKFTWENESLETSWEKAEMLEDRVQFGMIIEAMNAYIFPDGIGFLIAQVRLAKEQPTIHDFLKGNNRVRVSAVVDRLYKFLRAIESLWRRITDR